MNITCPECGFSRELDENKIPARAEVATCPKCKNKFKFRNLVPLDDFELTEVDHGLEPIDGPSAKEREEKRSASARGAENEAAHPETGYPEGAGQGEEPPSPESRQPSTDIWERLGGMSPESRTAGKQEADRADDGETPSAGEDFPKPQPSRDASHHEPLRQETPRVEEYKVHEQQTADEEARNLAAQQYMASRNRRPKVDVPFENMHRYGFFGGFALTVKRLILSPSLFFDVMPLKGVSMPVLFSLLLLELAHLGSTFWQIIGLTPTPQFTDTGLQFVYTLPLDTLQILGIFILAPLSSLFASILFAMLYHLVLMAFQSAPKGFEATLRGSLYANMPLLLIVLPSFNPLGFKLVYALMTAWSLVLTVVGCKHLHRISYVRAAVALVVMLLVVAFFAAVFLMRFGGSPTV